VQILGGAAHSIPLTWFQALSQAGAPAHMDAVVIHPYTVAPEQLGHQIDLLRKVPGFEAMPIEVTEFGHDDPARAPAHLVTSYCQMALNGVRRVVWYPLNPRGDDLVALLHPDGSPTQTGQTFQRLQELSQGHTVAAVAPDPFTFGCRFGTHAMVLWGAPRQVDVAAGVLASDVTGRSLDRDDLMLSMERPLVLTSSEVALRLDQTVTLGPQQVLADSVLQFGYPGGATADPFQRLVRWSGGEAALETRPGQEKSGAPWTPYLGTSRDGVARAAAPWGLPSAPSAGPLEIVYVYDPPTRLRADLSVEAAPSHRSTDGIDLTLRHGRKTLWSGRVHDAAQIDIPQLRLRPGRKIEIAVGPGGSARGDVTQLRVVLRTSAP